MNELPAPDQLLTLTDGRVLGYDDRGDTDGDVALFFHGTPDTRLARHPDDSIATSVGLRIISADRPGLGSSDVDVDATPTSVADDHKALLDHLGVVRAHVIAWSAGTIPALAFAGRHADRTASVTLMAPLIPADAYDSPGVLEGSDDSRKLFAEIHGSMDPGDVGRELAMWLVPPEIDDGLARDLLEATGARVGDVPGAIDAMVAALRGSVAHGMVGLEREIAAQATALGSLLDDVGAPVTIHVGTDDTTTPPPMGEWLAARLSAGLHVHDDDHLLAITRWETILRGVAGV